MGASALVTAQYLLRCYLLVWCVPLTRFTRPPPVQEMIIKEGDVADRLFIITRGVVACEGVVYTR